MTDYVISSGQTSGFTVTVDDTETVLSGGTASGSVISGGDATVESGGAAQGTTVSGYGLETVDSGAVTTGTTAFAGGVEYLVGGTASAATVSSGGIMDIESGGTASNATVTNQAHVNVLGGVALGTTVGSGGIQNVDAGMASGTIIQAGGRQFVLSGTVAAGSLIASGGEEIVSSGGVASGTVVAAGGVIDLVFLGFSGDASATVDASDTLTVTEGGTSYTQALSGDYAGDVFALSQDAASGTLVTVESPACFCAGTRISTAHGQVAVEALAIGDRVVTASGALRAVRWLGQRRYGVAFAARNRAVWPVVIGAGALGGGLPWRDLLVSPDHALLLDGHLIAAGHLVNGRSIRQPLPRSEVSYVHVELETHDILLAEGVPAESFVADGARGMFENAGSFRVRYPDAASGGAVPCAPRLASGPVLEAVYRRIGAMADARRAG